MASVLSGMIQIVFYMWVIGIYSEKSLVMRFMLWSFSKMKPFNSECTLKYLPSTFKFERLHELEEDKADLE